MNELDEIRQRRLNELQTHIDVNQSEHNNQMQQQVEMLENVVKQKFSRDALSRYGNIKAAHPEKAIHLLAVIGQIMEKNNITQISDEDLKEILRQLVPQKRETKIIRK